jgi:hypothetical protein
MHAPIYQCRFNCGGICSTEEFAVDALTNFLDRVGRSGACRPQSRVLLRRWCMSEDSSGLHLWVWCAVASKITYHSGMGGLP